MQRSGRGKKKMKKGRRDRVRRLVPVPRWWRRSGDSVDDLISGPDYLLITIRREPLEEEENV